MGSFYLTVIDTPLTDIWYKNQAMGVKTINTMLISTKKVTITRFAHKQSYNKPLCKKNYRLKIKLF